MNTSALKTFAPAVRKQLMEAVTRKLDYALSAKTPDYLTTFAPQVAALRKLAQEDRPGLIERVAYTWFNRFAALRFMDARGWHPFRARVITPATAEETQPELLKLTRAGTLPEDLRIHTNPSRLNDLLDGRIPSADTQGEVYRHLVLAACHFYNALLPNLFEKLDDETELLLPDDLLTEHSVVQGFRTEISDEDCSEVELLGWLYQFYISERKDQVMARKSSVPTEDIPSVTQLFTPHWIVRYLVENSLGRLWLLNHPGSKLREHMPYHIAESSEAFGERGKVKPEFLKISKPEDIKLVDPAAGSGHMLTYAFDLLFRIYEEEGYASSDIPALILRHNLHGLDICPRAAQLAELALIFKAREKSRRFFQAEHIVRPMIMELQDVRFGEGELASYFKTFGSQPSALHPQLVKLLHQFEEAKNFGSLIQPCLSESEIVSVRSKLSTINSQLLTGDLMVASNHIKVLRVLEQAESLSRRYHVVVANPPYMGGSGMNLKLKAFCETNYHMGKGDLYAAFMLRNSSLSIERGVFAMITIPNWMFLTTYAAMRRHLLKSCTLLSLIDNGRGVWGSDFGSCEFIFENIPSGGYGGRFKRLFSKPGEVNSNEDLRERFQNDEAYPVIRVDAREFEKVPEAPIAFWISPKLRDAFSKYPAIGGRARKGLTTADNERFVRLWFEISQGSFTIAGGGKWFPMTKGGAFRKWYGNREYVVNWANNGEDLKAFVDENGRPRAVLRNVDYYLKEGVSWNDVSMSYFSARFVPSGVVCNAVGPMIYGGNIPVTLAMLNSVVNRAITSFLCPTVKFEVGAISLIPVSNEMGTQTEQLSDECVSIARADWDNFETSWDFRDLPLLRPGLKGATLEASWRNWEARSTAAIRRMKELETENNRLFITAYGLDGELQPEVPEEQITLARADARRDMAAFLSYAVGCMMGRYGLDHPGLILANSSHSLREFVKKIGLPKEKLTFVPDEDGIIPVLDGEWFEDDIVARTRDFLRVTFGDATLRENIRFIEESLGKDLRKYFLTDFYRDHLQTYKKRPIYWMVQSPRKGFNVLIYLHHYTKDTMNLVLNSYLRDYQVKLRNRIAHLAQVQATASTAKDKTEARKESDKLNKTLHECDEWERQTLLPLAQARIEFDLDDGVKVNYLKLGEALAPIAGLASKEEE
jgi:hypothetical protein